MIWSIDPGETTGVAAWTERGTFISKRKFSVNEVLHLIQRTLNGPPPGVEHDPVTKLVIEEWGFDPGKTQRGNKMVSSQVIGMFKLLAKMQDAEVIMQDRRILKVSALHTGTPIPKNGHFDDDISAYLHGHYYFVVNGILKPPNQVH